MSRISSILGWLKMESVQTGGGGARLGVHEGKGGDRCREMGRASERENESERERARGKVRERQRGKETQGKRGAQRDT